ncbi:MAG TPA: hypothetical protein EYP14_18630 [Planctomycetaceae bacterium]|nr:hypothetical protein [Planctomycetaceae bacterium]
MASWREKATRLLNRTAQQEPVPFELLCPCGETIRGTRRNRCQRVLCKSCGEPYFVLPVSVYPPPRRGKKKKQSLATADGAKQALTHVHTSVRQLGQRAKRRTVEAAKSWGASSVEAVRRTVTPFRVIMLSVIVVVGGTGYWVHRSRARERAEVQFKQSVHQGQAALKSGDLFSASKAFAEAVAALDVIGRDDRLARATRQMYRECRAASVLCPKTLLELVREADAVTRKGGASAWQAEMRSRFAGTWVVLHTRVRRSVGANGEEHLIVDYPLMVGGRPVELLADLHAFRQLDWSALARQQSAADRQGVELIFAAQLEDCRLEDGTSERWVVVFDPRSGFLWSDYANYRTLGFRPETAHSEQHVKKLLSWQSKAIGIEG